MSRRLYIRVRNEKDCNHVKTLVIGDKVKIRIGKIFKQKPIPFYDGMPEFSQVKKEPYCLFEIETKKTTNELSTLFCQNFTDKTKSIWFPKLVKEKRGRWISKSNIRPKYPIYVISKDRPNCITSKSLLRMGVQHKIVIEPQNFNEYEKIHGADILAVLPFKNLGIGSTPARNWVWDDSISNGFSKHWVLDDNIEDFNFLKDNTKDPVLTPSIFRYAEDFTELFDNVGQSGFNYYSFCKATDGVPPYYLNTRVYSCILIKNDLPFRWRGKYNEDTDLSIRILKSGMCTILFNQMLAGKVTTMRMKGGNTDHVYTDGDNRLKFAQSLAEQHPDIVKVTTKFGRYHHQVNYKGFNQKLILKNKPDFDYSKDMRRVI